MERYAPDKMELAPRDLISRAEQTEIEEGRGVGPDAQGLYLDLRHLGEQKIRERLPQVRELAMQFVEVDMIEAPVPIQPTAHYSMGGIPADANGQVIADADGTPVVGFYAAGECACISVHGANRLGTNSLLDASVFGRRTGRAMAEFIKNGAELLPIDGDPANRNNQRIRRLMDDDSASKNPGTVNAIAEELKTTMTQNCGIFRDEERLTNALQKVKELQERFKSARIMDKTQRFNTDLLSAFETEHLLTFSEVTVASGLARTESRGAHYRTDFPKRDDESWLKHTLATPVEDEPALSYKSVYIDWEEYPPKERKY